MTALLPHRLVALCALSSLIAMVISEPARAHSASDAYLTLSSESAISTEHGDVHGQWDISLRDLDFVLKLDDDGDGRVTWGEVRHHQAAIEDYAYRHLQVDAGAANTCTIKPRRLMIDAHADGAYAALFFNIVCAHVVPKLTLHYSLFFDIDPSHRGIFVMHKGTEVATALLAPDNTQIALSP